MFRQSMTALALIALAGCSQGDSGGATEASPAVEAAAAPAASALYGQPMAVMGVAPVVLFGLARLWLQAWRGELHSDPVLHALRDKVSYLLIALCVLWVFVASWL